MAGAVIAPVLNLMREGLGVAPASVGLIITTHGLFMALFSPLMGSLIDRLGTRRPYILGLMAYGLAGGSGLFINSYWVLIASRAVLGIALAAVFTAITVWILNSFHGMERDRIMGWRGSAQSLGGVIWPLIGGALGGVSWKFPFAVYLLGLLLGLLAILYVPEPESQTSRKTQTDDASVLKIFRESPVIWAIYSLMFLASVNLYVLVIFLPQLLETLGVTGTFHIGLLIATMTSTAGLIAFVYGRIKSHLSFRAIVLAATVIWTAALVNISRADSMPVIAVSMAVFGAGHGLVMPTVMLWIGEAVPVAFRGRFSSYLGTFGYLGQFSSPILFSPVLYLTGLRGVFVTAAGIGLLLFLTFLIFVRENRGSQPMGN
jgi:MFS family permease